MTRETKIGLLVGLAFIIVIGILLSDHLTSTTDPPQAQLAQAGSNVRSAVSTPGGAAPAESVIAPPTNVAPQQPVPTEEELSPKPPPVQIVHIGPGATPPPAQIAPQVSDQKNEVAKNDPPITREAESKTTGNSSLIEVAKSFNEPLVPVGSRESSPPTAKLAAVASGKQYKAEPGDSVSKLAARFLGGNTKVNRDAILKANPSLADHPDKIIVGQTYVIPTSAEIAPHAGAERSAAPDASPKTTQAAGDYIYTVKPGDSLSKIAVEQLGSASTIAAIKELNKDVLKDENTITVGMKLRLPAKPIASAQ